MRLRVKIYTSIAPFDIERQTEAISSWIQEGYKVISVNQENDNTHIEGVEYRNVAFTNVFGTNHVPIDVIIEEIKKDKEHIAVIVNSDIILVDSKAMQSLVNFIDGFKENVIYCKKYNEQNGIEVIEKHGIDMFIFNSKNCDIIEKSTLCFGKPLWDFWIPFMWHRANKKILAVETRFLLHRHHERKWNKNDWMTLIPNYDRFSELANTQLKFRMSTVKKLFARSIIGTFQ